MIKFWNKPESVEVEPEANFYIDFNKMDVVSIERSVDSSSKRTCTIIGYAQEKFSEFSEFQEWAIYCTVEQHNRLIEAYKRYKQSI